MPTKSTTIIFLASFIIHFHHQNNYSMNCITVSYRAPGLWHVFARNLFLKPSTSVSLTETNSLTYWRTHSLPAAPVRMVVDMSSSLYMTSQHL